MYAQEQAQQTQTDAESPPKSDGGENQAEGEVVDAEFEEVKDKK
jgi:hypothetical protein